MAAINRKPEMNPLFAAAMAIPMVAFMPGTAMAGSAPEQTTVGFKYLSYKDYERDADRMKVTAPMVWVDAPVASDLEIQASVMVNSISGASPIRPNVLKPVTDKRDLFDIKLTKYLEDYSIGVGISDSRENDYQSQSVSLDTRFEFNQRNTTLALGIGVTRDKIDSQFDPAPMDQRKRTDDFLIGITQLIDPQSLIQTNLALSWGRGYFSDPYKSLDSRPDARNQAAWLVRYVRFSPRLDGALHADYRYFTNDWGVRAHTVDLSWYQNLDGGWKLIPGVRYYRQNQADFYSNQFPPRSFDYVYYSTDQRLSSLGGLTSCLKLTKSFSGGWLADIKYEFYRQSAGLYLAGTGTPNINTFYAKAITFGVSKTF